MPYIQEHLTSSIIMVRPIDFGFNEQTGLDNEFQHRPQGEESEIRLAAQAEFDAMVEKLSHHKIEITLLGKNHTEQILPDAVFPNNWFSTRQDGTLFIYPMKTPNRRGEIQIEPLINALKQQKYQVNEIVDLRQTTPQNIALEGTGSLIFHHTSGSLFAAISERCDVEALNNFAQQYLYQLYSFTSRSASGYPVYHTNVLMSCGTNFAVIAPEVLTDNSDSERALNCLRDLVPDLIEISELQMRESFCGNIIQLQNTEKQPVIVLSTSAYRGFSASQRQILERHGELIVCEIKTIEHVGGGSARCMIGENFLPK